MTDRCGISDLLADDAALVVPFDQAAVSAALSRLFGDRELRTRIGAGAHAVAATWSWAHVSALQEDLYRKALAG